ncbi:D-sedoheptulose-7-phosphate isomerase [Bacteroides fragilis]|uniref:D-sedoheptulose-7-phosphate isomerase n=1 Tax=Bacteroides TaxID=816 RepID=UPI0022AA20F0|nr:SIS domain-containing protein [Bacteroides fragilis]MCZ2662003.1 SIS domain-containing protein [Bacteroides fragilis]
MEEKLIRHIDTLINRYPNLIVCKDSVIKAYEILEESYSKGGKLLVCGNGGSASDSEHIVGELMKEFKLKRKVYAAQAEIMKTIDLELGTILAEHLQGALPAITLTAHSSLITAFMNDSEPVLVFAQQVNGYGNPEDVFMGISTSGNSANVLYAAITAKARGLKVIGLTGAKENRLMKFADVCICVPETQTYKIQELHLPVYHCLCLMLEDKFFG